MKPEKTTLNTGERKYKKGRICGRKCYHSVTGVGKVKGPKTGSKIQRKKIFLKLNKNEPVNHKKPCSRENNDAEQSTARLLWQSRWLSRIKMEFFKRPGERTGPQVRVSLRPPHRDIHSKGGNNVFATFSGKDLWPEFLVVLWSCKKHNVTERHSQTCQNPQNKAPVSLSLKICLSVKSSQTDGKGQRCIVTSLVYRTKIKHLWVFSMCGYGYRRSMLYTDNVKITTKQFKSGTEMTIHTSALTFLSLFTRSQQTLSNIDKQLKD